MRFEIKLSEIIESVQSIEERNKSELVNTNTKKILLENLYADNVSFFFNLSQEQLATVVKQLVEIKAYDFLPRLLLGICLTQKIEFFCELIDSVIDAPPDEGGGMTPENIGALIESMHSPVMTRHNKTVAQKVLSQDSAFILEFINTKLFKDDEYKRSFWLHDENKQLYFVGRLKEHPEILHTLLNTCEYIETEMSFLAAKSESNDTESKGKTLLYTSASDSNKNSHFTLIIEDLFSKHDEGNTIYDYISIKNDSPDREEIIGLFDMLTLKQGNNGESLMHQLTLNHSNVTVNLVNEFASRQPHLLSELLCVADNDGNTPLSVLLEKTPNVFTEIMQLIIKSNCYQPEYNEVMKLFLTLYKDSKKIFGKWLPQAAGESHQNYINMILEMNPKLIANINFPDRVLKDVLTRMVHKGELYDAGLENEPPEKKIRRENFWKLLAQSFVELNHLPNMESLFIETCKRYNKSMHEIIGDQQSIEILKNDNFSKTIKDKLLKIKSIYEIFGDKRSNEILKKDTFTQAFKIKLLEDAIMNTNGKVLADEFQAAVRLMKAQPSILSDCNIMNTSVTLFLKKLLGLNTLVFTQIVTLMNEQQSNMLIEFMLNHNDPVNSQREPSSKNKQQLPLLSLFINKDAENAYQWVCLNINYLKELLTSPNKNTVKNINLSLSLLMLKKQDKINEFLNHLDEQQLIAVHDEMRNSTQHDENRQAKILFSEKIFDHLVARGNYPVAFVKSLYSNDYYSEESVTVFINTMSEKLLASDHISVFDAAMLLFLLTDPDSHDYKEKYYQERDNITQLTIGIALLKNINSNGCLGLLLKSPVMLNRFSHYITELHDFDPDKDLVYDFLTEPVIQPGGKPGDVIRRQLVEMYSQAQGLIQHDQKTTSFLCQDCFKNSPLKEILDSVTNTSSDKNILRRVLKEDRTLLGLFLDRLAHGNTISTEDLKLFMKQVNPAHVTSLLQSEKGLCYLKKDPKIFFELLNQLNDKDSQAVLSHLGGQDPIFREDLSVFIKSKKGLDYLRNDPNSFLKLLEYLKENNLKSILSYEIDKKETFLDYLLSANSNDIPYERVMLKFKNQDVLFGKEEQDQFFKLSKAWKKDENLARIETSLQLLSKLCENHMLKLEMSELANNFLSKQIMQMNSHNPIEPIKSFVQFMGITADQRNSYYPILESEFFNTIKPIISLVFDRFSDWIREYHNDLNDEQMKEILNIFKLLFNKYSLIDKYDERPKDFDRVYKHLEEFFPKLASAFNFYYLNHPEKCTKELAASLNLYRPRHDKNAKRLNDLFSYQFGLILEQAYFNLAKGCDRESTESMILFFLQNRDFIFDIRFCDTDKPQRLPESGHPFITFLDQCIADQIIINSDTANWPIIDRDGRNYRDANDNISWAIERGFYHGKISYDEIIQIREKMKKVWGIKSDEKEGGCYGSDRFDRVDRDLLRNHLNYMKNISTKNGKEFFSSLFNQLMSLRAGFELDVNSLATNPDYSAKLFKPSQDTNVSNPYLRYETWLNQFQECYKRTGFRLLKKTYSKQETKVAFLAAFPETWTLSLAIPLDFENFPEQSCRLYKKLIKTFCQLAQCPVKTIKDFTRNNKKLNSWVKKNDKDMKFYDPLMEFVETHRSSYEAIKDGPSKKHGPSTKHNV